MNNNVKINEVKVNEVKTIEHICPHCNGTGIEKVEPYPFQEFPDDSNISIRAAKSIINCLYKWKDMRVDASGHEYKPDEHIESLARATTILEEEGISTPKEIGAIITYLMNDKTKPDSFSIHTRHT
jgi:hypothetical protein